jgi:hypothetical protein
MRHLLLSLALLLPVALASSARADDLASADHARARFAAGVRLYDAREFEGALEEFRAARALRSSPAITRNVALCLKALERWGEAIDAFEELLSEGGDGLAADVRTAAQRALEELGPRVVDVRVRVLLRGPLPVPVPTVSVDRAAIPAARLARPLHLAPGDHELSATADGYFEARQRVRLGAGQGETTLDLEPTTASLVGSATRAAPAAPPQLVVERPAEARAVAPTPAPRPDWYVSGGLGLFGEALVFTGALDDPNGKHALGGASLLVRGGRRLGAHVSAGLACEVAGLSSGPYDSASDKTVRPTADLVQWLVVPELRVHGTAKLRPFGGLGLGVEGTSVKGTVSSKATGGLGGGTASVSGSGASLAVLLEGGGQLDLGPFYLELALFLDVHGVGNVSSGAARLFSESPVARSGARAMVGYSF